MIQTQKEYTQQSYQDIIQGYKKEIEILKRDNKKLRDKIKRLIAKYKKEK